MTRCESDHFGKILKHAVLGAALFFCAPVAVAQDVTLTSKGGGLTIDGRYIGFDGENIQIDSVYGPLTMRFDTVDCVGDPCPDPANYVPELRLSGAARMADVLMPALVDGFARSKGLRVAFDQIDDTHFV